MNSNSDSSNNNDTRGAGRTIDILETDLTMAVDFELDDPFDKPQIPADSAAQPRTLDEEYSPEKRTDNQQFSEFEFNEDEFSIAFEQTLSSTVLAIKQSEDARIENPTSDDLQDADIAVKWLRKNRFEHNLANPEQLEANEPDKSSASFKVFAMAAFLMLILYVLYTQTTYLESAFSLLKQWRGQ